MDIERFARLNICSLTHMEFLQNCFHLSLSRSTYYLREALKIHGTRKSSENSKSSAYGESFHAYGT